MGGVALAALGFKKGSGHNQSENDDRDGTGGTRIVQSDRFETVHAIMCFAVGGPAPVCGGNRAGPNDPERKGKLQHRLPGRPQHQDRRREC